MERHRCALCFKIFSNGRALGGHMRSHLATLPLPPKKDTDQPVLGDPAHSDSSSTRSQEDKLSAGYGLRANPKRSFKGSDPGLFLDDAGSAVQEQEQEQEQDRESETDSTHNPTRRRSKRTIHKKEHQTQEDHREIEYSSAPVSSVSDASQDEEVALCLMMLSRDDRVWLRRATREEKLSVQDTDDDSAGFTTRGDRRKCETNRAQLGHGGHKERESSKEYQAKKTKKKKNNNNNRGEKKIYECPFCRKVFASGQALGGHKRSHLLASTTSNNSKVGDDHSFSLDLNLPAPIDDDHDDQDHSQLDFF